MDQDDALIARLSADLRPVRPQRPHAGWGLLALAVLGTAALVHLGFGLKPGIVLSPDGRWVLLAELVLAALGLACALAVVAMASPSRTARPAAFWLVAAASLLPVAGLVVLAVPGFGDGAVHSEQGHWECALWGSVSSLLTAAVLVGWLRRGAPASPARAGLYTGLASGALGSAIYGLSCPITGFEHWALWHFLPVLACGLVGRLALPRLLRW
ncbi:DUF1109 domain-containing protein [Luteimonas sp. WGS1318]|uniref:DUF1109 domain-containing protein n=1 Tax=Luteimonas sp. WGS1318 TaxID=3366815 RepID=UPI00372D4467